MAVGLADDDGDFEDPLTAYLRSVFKDLTPFQAITRPIDVMGEEFFARINEMLPDYTEMLREALTPTLRNGPALSIPLGGLTATAEVGPVNIEPVDERAAGELRRSDAIVILFALATTVLVAVLTKDALEGDVDQLTERAWQIAAGIFFWCVAQMIKGDGADHG